MSAPDFFRRYCEIDIDGLIVTDPKIVLDIKLSLDPSTQDNGTVSIYNLSRLRERRINHRGAKIKVVAGYQNFNGVVFDGAVQRVERAREQLARITKLSLTSQIAADDTLGGVSNLGYQSDVSLKTVVADLVNDINGVELGDTSIIPDINLSYAYWAGKSWKGLVHVLDSHDILPYVDSGLVEFSRVNEAISDGTAHRLSAGSGLIGAPTVTDDGARVRSLLDYRYRLNTYVTVESESFNDTLKVAAITHGGSNWDGEWFTELELLTQEAIDELEEQSA